MRLRVVGESQEESKQSLKWRRTRKESESRQPTIKTPLTVIKIRTAHTDYSSAFEEDIPRNAPKACETRP